MAAVQDADVIQVNKDSQPPLCRLLSLDKWKFEQGKAEREAKKKQRENRHAPGLSLCAPAVPGWLLAGCRRTLAMSASAVHVRCSLCCASSSGLTAWGRQARCRSQHRLRTSTAASAAARFCYTVAAPASQHLPCWRWWRRWQALRAVTIFWQLHQMARGAVTEAPSTCRQDTKELKLRLGTDTHDYDVRVRNAQKFISKARLGPVHA